MPRTTNPELVAIYIRLNRGDVAEARRLAGELKMPYQHIIRGWVKYKAGESRDELAKVKTTAVKARGVK